LVRVVFAPTAAPAARNCVSVVVVSEPEVVLLRVRVERKPVAEACVIVWLSEFIVGAELKEIDGPKLAATVESFLNVAVWLNIEPIPAALADCFKTMVGLNKRTELNVALAKSSVYVPEKAIMLPVAELNVLLVLSIVIWSSIVILELLIELCPCSVSPEEPIVFGVVMSVVNVGDVPNTSEPEPVSSVTAEIKFADDGVAKNVATFEPRPLTPVEIGRPVALVSVPADGVPMSGVTSVGLFANTSAPLPVSSDITPASSAEVVAAKAESLSVRKAASALYA
jgi:hypothetical protein